MFVHTVLMRLNPRAGAEFDARVAGYCRRILADCTGVRAYWYGANEADRHSGFTHAVVGCFDTREDHDAYQVSDAHLAMKAYMASYIDEMAVLDAQIPVVRLEDAPNA